MVSSRSQNDLLQGTLYNVWNRSVNWELPINPTKYNCIAIGLAPLLQLCLATGSPGNSVQVANVVKWQLLLACYPLQSSTIHRNTSACTSQKRFIVNPYLMKKDWRCLFLKDSKKWTMCIKKDKTLLILLNFKVTLDARRQSMRSDVTL